MEFYLFSAAKMVHIASLIFWLGPTLGSWWVLINIRKGHQSSGYQLAYKIFLQTLWVEHIAFIALLASGATMATLFHFWGQPWLNMKLGIILAVIIPLEIIDIYIGNFYLPKHFNIDRPSQLEKFYHGPFTKTAIALIPLSVFSLFILAVAKPTP